MSLIDSLNAIPDVEVHHVDRDNNKLIVVQEAQSIRKEIYGLKKIKKLPVMRMKDSKVTSFWIMGMNQHYRGSWVNEQIYTLHLLLGK